MPAFSSSSAAAAATYIPPFVLFKKRTVRTERVLRLAILSLIFVVAFFTRLFSVVRYESIIHEFDPWFNFRATKKIAADGFYSFWSWFDDRSWYPLGRVVGGTIYPGLMITAGIIHKFLGAINFPLDIRNICVFIAPAFSGLTAYSVYLMTTELHSRTAGLFAAGFMAIAPGYISRSVAGSYDNEAIAIFLLMFCFHCWIRAVKIGSALWSAVAALVYFYMVSSWGGYVFITNLIPLHVFTLLLLGRYSNKIYVVYCTWYVIGTIASFSIPFVLFAPVGTSEHMAAMGVFGLLQIVAVTEWVRSLVSGQYFRAILRVSVAFFFVITLSVLVALTYSGFIAPWTGRFYSLWDVNYARIHIPIISSVSEHQPTSWASLFLDLHCLMFLFPVGVLVCFRRLRNEHIFVIVYSLLASYFAGVMVRLILALTPIVCVAAGIALGELFGIYGLPANWNCEGNKMSKVLVAASIGPNKFAETDESGRENSNEDNERELKKSIGGANDDNYHADDDEGDAEDEASINSNAGRQNHAPKKNKNKKAAKAISASPKGGAKQEEKQWSNGKRSAGSANMDSQWQKKNAKKSSSISRQRKEINSSEISWTSRSLVFLGVAGLMVYFMQHCTWVTQTAYSSPSVVLSSSDSKGNRVIIDDFREAYYWLRKNTEEDATVMAWWDYGYQIAGMANRTTLVDNNTWNNTHIATVGRAMASSEDAAYPILRALDVDYLLVIFGGLTGYSGDDINKFLWMVRIGQGVYPEHVEERKFFTERGEYRVDDQAPAQMRNSLMYKMSYYRFADVFGGPGSPGAIDRVRQTPITSKKITLHTIDEVYTSERWLVRIYKVRKPDFLGRSLREAAAFESSFKSARRSRKTVQLL